MGPNRPHTNPHLAQGLNVKEFLEVKVPLLLEVGCQRVLLGNLGLQRRYTLVQLLCLRVCVRVCV